ncbi:MAG: SDR family NAD(P)-dependent oxidoreductase [Mycobacterium sp.]|nr:SDR family NAD(P)-dependent oxidoreductase [Mycobacterium sp.]MBV9721819.1 SDR family NAD(P)-dependent oxidoreductase [Mycobacterium sp.]
MRVIVTGGNSGIGKATAAALAAAGHSVMIACRTIGKAEQAAAAMQGDVAVAHLDLADLASVRKFVDSVDDVDVLINNAGVLGLPLTRTADGFETHMGTNYLGHFALTCLLGDRIKDRVISVVSSAYSLTRLHIDDLNWRTRPYSKWAAYGESKLALMLFSHQLASRGVRTYMTDPGATDTDIARDTTGVLPWVREHTFRSFPAHSAATGARASIQAVTTELPSGSYLAPRFSQWGKPKVTRVRRKGRDADMARRLWALSVELTGSDWQNTGSE